MGYDFGIIYKKGKQNVVANALSRKDEDVEALLGAISIIQPYWINGEGRNGRMMKKCGHLFESYNKIPVRLIHLTGKMIRYGTKIAYTSVRIPS